MLFIGLRFLLASVAVAPFAWPELKRFQQQSRSETSATQPASKEVRKHFGRFVVLGCVFFVAMTLQQIGLMGTTVTNAGFLTTLYVVFVPFLLVVVLRQQQPPLVWPCAIVSIVGVYLLGEASTAASESSSSLVSFAWGDYFILACAVVWAIHVILIGVVGKRVAMPVTMACVQFFVCGVAGIVAHAGAVIWGGVESGLSPELLYGAAPEILYAGIVSGGVAFTLQAIGQRHTNASVAAILMASESLFAAILGATLLGERLALAGYVGCMLIFGSIATVELMHGWKRSEKLNE